MSISPNAILIPKLQSVFHAIERLHLLPPSRLVPIDSPATPGTIVHIVCNDAVRADCLREFFSSHSIDVNVFKTASEYMAYTGPERIACVILDLDLPDVGGLEAQSRLAERGGAPVVFVTDRSDLNSGVHAMKNGAIDFMIEPVDYNRLLAAVEIAFARERNSRRKRLELSSLLRRWNSLTPREQDVFQYTVAGFLNKQAAAELGITENTFQVHRGRVMRKMDADSLADLVRMATRLESLSHSLKKNDSSARSLKAFLSESVLQTPHPLAHRAAY